MARDALQTTVHPTAIVHHDAQIGVGTKVGPYTVIESGVVIGRRCQIGPHAHLLGPLTVGDDCAIGFGVAIGHDPQIKGGQGPYGATRIGNGNVFREHSQVHRSMHAGGETVIGDNGYFMAISHIGHDCHLGDDVVVCNNTLVAGHVAIGDRAFISGNVTIHQFVRLGELCMIGGSSAVGLDVPPFAMATGARPAKLHGLNVVGLRRAGLSAEVRRALQEAFQTLFRSDEPIAVRIEKIDSATAEVRRFLEFVKESKRGILGFSKKTRGVEEAD